MKLRVRSLLPVVVAATALILAPIVVPGAGMAAGAAETPAILKWADLVPPRSGPPPAATPRPFFEGAQPAPGGDEAAPPPMMAEGKFMSMKRRQPGADRPPELVGALDGKRISIGGYVVALDFEQTAVKEFLLVPFVGACIHVPPPPANQIVYVKASEAFELTDMFTPVTVTGTLRTQTASTGLADAGYTLEAETVTLRTE